MVKKNSDYRWAAFKKEKGWDGFNDAGINTFNSNVINSFVREMFQNSNDARLELPDGKKEKLRICIEYKHVAKASIPCYDDLLSVVSKISKQQEGTGNDLFFTNALMSLSAGENIGLFVYEDYNTTGLSGSDDDPKESFNACVLSEGTSIKSNEDSIGSFGIGKNSIYGLSGIRTVIYSSMNTKGERIIQGLAKLASYKDEHGVYEKRVYFGKGENLSSIRDIDIDFFAVNELELYKRSKPGLSQFAICPNLPDNWSEAFVKAILRNYWFLLINDELDVEIKQEGGIYKRINASTLEDLMIEYFHPDLFDSDEDSDPKGNPYDFYNCYRTVEGINSDVHMLGSIKFYFTELDHRKTNKVQYIRNGMVVFSDSIWGFNSIGYCGIIICDNKEGNLYLKMMEPPEHNQFDPSRLNDKTRKYRDTDGVKAFKEIKSIVRSSLNTILEKYRKQTEEIPWLTELMKSFDGITNGGGRKRTGNLSEHETIQYVGSDKEYSVSFDTVTRNIFTSTSEGESQGESLGNNKGKNKLGKGVGRVSNPGRSQSGKVRRTKTQFRIFKKSESEGNSKYKIILTSDAPASDKSFRINQVGDSGNESCFDLLSLIDISEKSPKSFEAILNNKGEKVGYKLNSINVPSTLEIVVKEPYKSTFTILES